LLSEQEKEVQMLQESLAQPSAGNNATVKIMLFVEDDVGIGSALVQAVQQGIASILCLLQRVY